MRDSCLHVSFQFQLGDFADQVVYLANPDPRIFRFYANLAKLRELRVRVLIDQLRSR